MAFSFEPFLAISAGHIMAVSAGPEHRQKILSDFTQQAGKDTRDRFTQDVYSQYADHDLRPRAK